MTRDDIKGVQKYFKLPLALLYLILKYAVLFKLQKLMYLYIREITVLQSVYVATDTTP